VVCALLIVAATLTAYWSSFEGAMVLDDDSAIVNNPTIRHLWPPGSVLSPPLNGSPVQGRPVINLSLAVNYALGRTNVWGYHAVNLAVHILAALTLFGIVRRTLLGCEAFGGATALRSPRDFAAQPRRTVPFGAPALALATAIALIWAVHPLQTESVTYISQRAESMAGLLLLLTLYCAMRSAHSPRPAAWSAAAVAACLVGMATKEIMAVAPLLVLLYDRSFLAGSFAEAFRRRWRLYAALAATWTLLAWLLLDMSGRPGTGGFLSDVTPFQYACAQFGAVVGYMGQSFWPGELVFDYGEPAVLGAGEIVPYAVAVAVLLVAAAVAMVRWKRWGFLGAWCFVILAPTSSFFRLSQVRAEHRMYLPLAAVVVFVVVGAYQLGTVLLRPTDKSETAHLQWAWVLAAVGAATVTAVLGYLTFQRNGDYRSEFSIWDDTVRKCPDNARARDGRGVALGIMGRPEEAMLDFDASLRLRPNFAKTYNNRGNAHLMLNQFGPATWDFSKAIELDPGFAGAYANRGAAYGVQDMYELALRDLSKAIELRGDYGEAYRNRAWAHYKVRDYDRAWADIRSARRFGAPPDPRIVQELQRASGRSE
jgi:tetratricopeptide (TPR) repeat protein